LLKICPDKSFISAIFISQIILRKNINLLSSY